ncbi:MAG: response regulator transcription factor, partial [Gammaproteobacteria bacterium]|nr:response regulator transcription factor [Gammaproteobacteria bacterium]
MNKILLIEDDVGLAELTRDFLQENGFVVDHAIDGQSGIKKCRQAIYDLIICDIMLPDISGFDLVTKLQQYSQCHFLFLTAMSQDIDQVKGFDLGASDYIIKPVNPKVLLARIRSILQLVNENYESDKIVIDQLEIDNRLGECQLNGFKLKLTPAEFNLLYILARHIDHPLSREQLFEEIVGREYNGLDRTIDGRVS